MDHFAFTIFPRAEILKLHDDSLLSLFNNGSDGINGAPVWIRGYRGPSPEAGVRGCRGDGVTVANLRRDEKWRWDLAEATWGSKTEYVREGRQRAAGGKSSGGNRTAWGWSGGTLLLRLL